MSLKTPQAIATDALTGYAMGHDMSREDVWQLIAETVEADRARTRFLLISEHDDTGVIGLYESRQNAADAARDNMHPDDADDWDDYYSIQEV